MIKKKDRELALFFTFLLGMSMGSPITWFVSSLLGVDVEAKETDAWMNYVAVAASFVVGLLAVFLAGWVLGDDESAD